MRLTRFRLRHPAPRPGPGPRTLARPGQGEDFFDHRPYVPGDDLRRLDWKALARTGRPYVRRFETPAAGRFWLWLDGSASMGLFGKAAYAERVARVLAAAAQGERLRVVTPRGARPPGRRIPADPRGLLAARPRGRGTPVLITDGLEEGDLVGYLRRLPPFHLVVVLAPEELDPPPGSWLLHDVETGETLPVDEAERAAYRAALRAHLAGLSALARRRGGFALLRVGEPILPALYRQGILELR